MSGALVRAGRRLSDLMMDAPWTVAHVERPNRPRGDRTAGARLTEALKLAEQLGGATRHADRRRPARHRPGLRPAQQHHPDRDRPLAVQPLAARVRPLADHAPCCGRSAGAALHIVTEGAPEPQARRIARARRAGTARTPGLCLAAVVFIAWPRPWPGCSTPIRRSRRPGDDLPGQRGRRRPACSASGRPWRPRRPGDSSPTTSSSSSRAFSFGIGHADRPLHLRRLLRRRPARPAG